MDGCNRSTKGRVDRGQVDCEGRALVSGSLGVDHWVWIGHLRRTSFRRLVMPASMIMLGYCNRKEVDK